MPELLAELTQENQRLRKRVERLIGALTEVSQDMHNTSTRPCGTCSQVTAILGEEFGCLRMAAETQAMSGQQEGGSENDAS